jgi:serine/threonine protein kinase
LQEKIMAGKYEPVVGHRWQGVSDEAKDLIVKLLVIDPARRLGAEDVLLHAWFVMDSELVRQAECWVLRSEVDSGRGSMVVKEGGEGKRKRNGDEDDEARIRLGKKRLERPYWRSSVY